MADAVILDFPGPAVDLDQFESYLVGLGKHEKTIRAYRSALRRADKTATEHGWHLAQLTPIQAVAIADAWPLSYSSRRHLRTALIHWWRSVGIEGPSAAIRIPKKPRGHYRGLEPEQAKILATTAQGWRPEGTVVLLGLYLGLRREEIATLRWDAFDGDMAWVTIVGKHDVTRVIPVLPVVKAELEAWRPDCRPGLYVFPGRSFDRAHINPATVWTRLQAVCEAAGLPAFRPHQLRHTALALMNDATGDLRTTQEFAGHTRPETTAVYTRTTSARLRAAAEALGVIIDV